MNESTAPVPSVTFSPHFSFISYDVASSTIIASPDLNTFPNKYSFSVIYNDDGSRMNFEIEVTLSEEGRKKQED